MTTATPRRLGAAYRRDFHPIAAHPPTRTQREAMRPLDLGDTITIQLTISIVGMGDVGDVLLVTETTYVENLLARGWAILYTGPTPPTILPTELGLIELSASQWATLDPVVPIDTLAVDSTNQIAKMGDGETPWSGLASLFSGSFASITDVYVEDFNLGSDAANLQAALNSGTSATSRIRIRFRSDNKTYTVGTVGSSADALTWDQTKGTVMLDLGAATIENVGTGKLLNTINSDGSALAPRLIVNKGYFRGLVCSDGVYGTDVRSFVFEGTRFLFPVGTFLHVVNQDFFCERIEMLDCEDVQEPGFAGSKHAVLIELAATRSLRYQAITLSGPPTGGAWSVTLPGYGTASGIAFDILPWDLAATLTAAFGATVSVGGTPGTGVYNLTLPATVTALVSPSSGTLVGGAASAAYMTPAGSFARFNLRNLKTGGGVFGECKIKFGANVGPYASRFDRVVGNLGHNVGLFELNGSFGESSIIDVGVEGLPRATETAATITLGSPVVLAPSITANDQGRPLTAGPGIPPNTYVGPTITPGVSFRISSSPSAQIDVPATANGTWLSYGTVAFLFRIGTLTGPAPDLRGTQIKRNWVMYDPMLPPPATTVQTVAPSQFAGIVAQHARNADGLDILGRQTAPLNLPLNPAVYVTGGGTTYPFTRFGDLIVQARGDTPRGIFFLDYLGNPLFGIGDTASKLGFYDKAFSAVAKQTIAAQRGTDAFQTALMTALANLGLLNDSTTAPPLGTASDRHMPILGATTAVSWTAMPAAATELFGRLLNRQRIDCTAFTQCRLIVNMSGAGASGAQLRLQWAAAPWAGATTAGTDMTDGTNTAAVTISGTSAASNPYASPWVTIPAGAKIADLYLRVVGVSGDGATTPSFGNIGFDLR